MRSGHCKLCLIRKPLQKSHYYPRALYKALRDMGEQNPNHTLLSDTTLVRKSQHIADYVLCQDCEQLFNQRGESWVARNAYTGKSFRLQQSILAATPVSSADDPRMIAYAGAEIPEVDMNRLVYFGISLFWRASVHKWWLLDALIHSPLGPHEEMLRRYLLLGEPLDNRVTINVFISPHQRPWPSFSTLPLQTAEGVTIARTFLAGITFELRMGNVTPADLEWCSYHSARRYIFSSTTMDDVNAYRTMQAYLKQSGLDRKWSLKLVT